MVREEARLTHATYSTDEFRSDNSGDRALPNGRDRKAIEDIPKLGSHIKRAFFGPRAGSVHVLVDESLAHSAYTFMHGRGYENSSELIKYNGNVEITFW